MKQTALKSQFKQNQSSHMAGVKNTKTNNHHEDPIRTKEAVAVVVVVGEVSLMAVAAEVAAEVGPTRTGVTNTMISREITTSGTTMVVRGGVAGVMVEMHIIIPALVLKMQSLDLDPFGSRLGFGLITN